MNLLKLLIKQHPGAAIKTIARKRFDTEYQAANRYLILRERLMDINRWGDFANKLKAIFCLTDFNGVSINFRKPEAGNLIRMQLSGPPNIDGSGYNWVRIEQIENAIDDLNKIEWMKLKVRPLENPFDKKEEHLASLYQIDSSSTFVIIRDNLTVWIFELGSHKIINSKLKFAIKNAHNTLVAFAAFAGVSTSQWKLLVSGIMNYQKEEIVKKEKKTNYSFNKILNEPTRNFNYQLPQIPGTVS